MARVAINTGSIANDGTGDTLRAAGGIINSNFSDIYNYFGDGTNLNFSGGNWEVTAVGINTLSSVGIGTTNPRFALEVGAVGASGTSLWVNGNARVTGILTVGTASIVLDGALNTISVGSGVTINGDTGIIDATSIVVGGTTITGAGVTRIEAGSGISVDQNTGQVTITATGGGGESYWAQNSTGINTTSNVGIGTTTASSALTVKGDTSLETLNVSGISTFGGQINPSSSGILFDTNTYTGSDTPIQLWIGNSGGARYFTLRRSNGGQVTFDNAYPTGHNDHRAPTHSFTQTGSEYYALFYNGSVRLYHPASASGILDQKFETIGAGVTVTGTTFTNQLSVSGISTLSNVDTVDLNVTGVTSVTSLTSQQLNVSGISTVGVLTATSLYGDASRTISGSWTVTGDGYSFTFVGIGLSVPTNDPVMYFARGCTYHIINNAGDHPFEIRDQENGFAYNNGVVGNGGTMTTIKFTVPLDAPNTLYYQCTDHVGMGNTIRVYPDRI